MHFGQNAYIHIVVKDVRQSPGYDSSVSVSLCPSCNRERLATASLKLTQSFMCSHKMYM